MTTMIRAATHADSEAPTPADTEPAAPPQLPIAIGAPAVPLIEEQRGEIVPHFRGRRERARALHARMAAFSSIYNAGYMLRDAYFATDEQRHEKAMIFIAAMLQEMRRAEDLEALLFSIADALYASPLGVPWEP